MELVPASEYWDLIANSVESPILALVYRLPPRLHRQIEQIQRELSNIDRRQLYSPLSTLHITVKGYGLLRRELDNKALASIFSKTKEVVSEFSHFELKFRGLSYFPTSIYIKVEDPFDQLRMINKRLISELGSVIETSQYDGDGYIPHVTIATFNTKEAASLIAKINSKEMKDVEIGCSEVFELEAVEARMFLLFGPHETQDQGLSYVRSFPLATR